MARGRAGDLDDCRARRPGMKLLERRSLRPVHHLLRSAFPQAARRLLDAAHDPALVLVAIGDDDAQDLEHGIGIIRIPTAGAEADLAENLAVMKGAPGESGRSRN